MSNIVVDFLKSFARQNNYTVYDSIFGDIKLTSNTPVEQSSGAVYGIWVESTTPIFDGVLQIPNHKNWYPLYWGKDISPVSRIKAHVQGHTKNGNLNMKNIPVIQGKKIIYGAILVSNYFGFETLLHAKHKPYKGTSKRGSVASIIKIVN